MEDFKHVVTVSGGLTSAYVANLVLKEHDADLIFTDTGWEDPDLFRFLEDLERLFNKKIIRIKHERYKDPEDLFVQEGVLGSSRIPVCSRKLKVRLLQQYLKKTYKKKCIVYFGIDHSEKHRADRIKFQYDKRKIPTRFPLVEAKDFFIKDKIIEWLNSNNIEIPRLYKDGYLHNNCSGGCVRSGKKSWLHLLKMNPEVYAERERMEREFKDGSYTIIKGMSLKELREKQEKISCEITHEDELPCVCFEV